MHCVAHRAYLPFVSFSLVTLGLCVSVGCSGTGSTVADRAQTVFRETAETSPDHAVYALAISRNSTAPAARDFLLESVTAKQHATALEAVKTLLEQPPEEARESLAAVFASRRGALKLNAAVALARLDDEAALSWLREEMSRNTGPLNVAAMTLFAERGEREVIEPVLRDRMQSEDAGIRNEAYAVLGEIRQPWSTRLLLAGLDKEFGEERRQPIVSLGRSGDPEVADRIARFVNTKGLVFATIEALGELGDEQAVPSLKKMAGHDQNLVRVYAHTALIKLGHAEDARSGLQELVVVDDPKVRENLANQLGAVDGELSTEILGQLVTDSAKTVRVAALRALTDREAPRLEKELLAAALDPDYEIATAALNALARSGGPEAIPGLEPLLEAENPYVAISAAHAILAVEGRRAPS